MKDQKLWKTVGQMRMKSSRNNQSKRRKWLKIN